jgi:ribonuclease P protein subunit POP4
VPKEHTVFRFEIPLDEETADHGDVGGKDDTERSKPLVFEIHGHAFETRAPERATKRVVLHLPKDL